MKRALVVSLIGRPNVGKSTIFNRLLRRRGHKALTFDQPGVTRDRHYAIATFDERADIDSEDVIVVDTGGFYPEKIEETKELDPFFNIMADQAKLAINESDLVLFVVDAREGLLPFDDLIANYLRLTKKNYWVLVNKFDTEKQEGDQYQFIGLTQDDEQFYVISAEHNRGLIDLRERIQLMAREYQERGEAESDFLQKGVKPNHDVAASLAIIGAPNVGKSTLLNQLVGSTRALVSPIAGTTVDPIEAYIDLYFGKEAKDLVHTSRWRRDTYGMMEDYLKFAEEEEKRELLAAQNGHEEFSEAEDEEEEIVAQEQDSSEALWDNALISDEEVSDELWSEEQFDQFVEMKAKEDIEVKAFEEALEQIEVDPRRSIKIVDTAGIRKSKLVKDYIEEQSVFRSLRSITESDIVIFMVDAEKGMTHQDRRLMDISLEKGKSLIICLNKIDLIQSKIGDAKKRKAWLEDLKAQIPWLSFCQLVTISAKRGTNISALKNAIKETILVRCKKVSTGVLNRALDGLIQKHQVNIANSMSKPFKVKYAAMVKNSPPTFIMFTNRSKEIPDNYRKYLQNGLRKEFNLINTPVHLIFRTTTDMERNLKKVSRGMVTK